MEKIMKHLMLGTAMALVFGASASAQELFRTEMDPIAIPASDFIGKRVYAVETAVDADEYDGVQEGWNDIGEINDIILTRDAKVDAVLIDIGGFLGMGERQVAVGMENIRFVSNGATAEDLNDFFLVVNADKAVMEGAPEYMRTGGAMPADATKTEDTADAEKTNIPAVDEAMATNDQAEVAATDPATDPAVVGGAMAVDGYAAVDASNVTSEQLMGVRVYGPNDEDLGEISDLVLDGKGAPTQIIIDVGGFLGMGEKPVAIDVTTLQILKETDGEALRAYVQMTQDELKALPAAKR
jgi:sporulation protein YlmC with PRC-barrel domain